MRYRVGVTVGDFTGALYVEVDADSPTDAKAEAEELVKSSAVEAIGVMEI